MAKKFEGVLSKPMVLPGLLGNAEAEAKDWKERIDALYERYGVRFGEPGADRRVAMGLAVDVVPGFKTQLPKPNPKGGPIPTWVGLKVFELYADVEVLVRKGKKKSNAFVILSKRARYRKYSSKTLHRRYYDFPNNAGILRRTIMKMRDKNAPIDDWIIEQWSDPKFPL